MKIEMFSKPSCIQCTQSSRKLDARGLKYTKTDLMEDPNALTFVKSLGHMAAPVIVIRDAAGAIIKSWAGFRPDEIDSLAASVSAQ